MKEVTKYMAEDGKVFDSLWYCYCYKVYQIGEMPKLFL